MPSDAKPQASHGRLYVRLRGNVQGPYEADRLRAMARGGRFSRLHEVSIDGHSWRRATDFPDLFPCVEFIRRRAGAANDGSITFGHDPSCDQVLDSPQISRRHARARLTQSGVFIEDLGSTNGTFVNGRRVTAPLLAQPGDVVSLGCFDFQLQDDLTLVRYDRRGEVVIEASGVAVNIRAKRLLENVSLTIEPKELVALMGPAGAGKTTLLNALNGYSVPSGGRVLINGEDLYSHYDLYRGQIGYVPQDDIMHRDLTVEEALFFTARLRLPADFADQDIARRIGEVIAQLGLQGSERTLVGSPERRGISGGERKRVNLAMELLTDPAVLFLDEPTSGLSSEDTLTVVKLLRGLADKGKTILLTLHQPGLEAFKLFDNLAIIARDRGSAEPGRLVYYGRAYPDSVEFFNPDGDTGAGAEPTPDAVLRGLAKLPSAQWAQRYASSSQYQDFVARRAGRVVAGKAQDAVRTPPAFDLLQLKTLAARAIRIKRKDVWNTAILMAQAPIIALLVVLVFDERARAEVSPDNWVASVNAVATTTFLLALAAIWFGCSNSAREIVGEWAIYRRERMVNLSIPAYVMSKLLVLGGLNSVQCAVLLAIVHQGNGLVGSWLAMFAVLLAASTAGLAIGLLLSAVSRSSEVALALLPLALLPMVILGGALIPVHKMPAIGRAIAPFMPARWAFEGLLLSETNNRPKRPKEFDINAPIAEDGPTVGGEFIGDYDMAEESFPKSKSRVGPAGSTLILVGIAGTLVAVIHLVLRVRDLR